MFAKRTKRNTNFECQIILKESVNCCNSNSDVVQGAFVITTLKPTEIFGFGIRLEGKAKAVLLRKSKDGERAEYRRSEFYFLYLPFNNFELSENNLIHLIPVHIDAVGEETADDFPNRRLTLKEGKQVYQFCLNLQELSLFNYTSSRPLNFPSTFKHDYGSIQYYLSMYVKLKSKSNFIKSCQKVLCQGVPPMIQVPPKISNNLGDTTVSVSRRREGSRKETFVEGTLLLNRMDYVSGENVEFCLNLQNQCDSSMNKISVSLVQKLAFRAGGYVKSVFDTLILKEKVSHELRDMMKTGREDGTGRHVMLFTWQDTMRIPRHDDNDPNNHKKIMPSFKTDEKCLEIFYFVQFIATITGNGTLTGEIPITIGTHHHHHHHHHQRRQSETPAPSVHRHQRNEEFNFVPAPAYSQLSLETLPPTYEETMMGSPI